MNLLGNWLYVALLTVCFGMNAAGQDQDQSKSIHGPVLGFVQDRGGEVIRPIFGVLGASLLGPPLLLDSAVRNAIISPNQDYAIAVRTDDAAAVMIHLDADSPSMRPLAGIRAGADVIAISGKATAAAIYDHEKKFLQSIRPLTEAPEIVFEFDASDIPGQLQNIAIADDGTVALLNLADGDQSALWVVNSTGFRALVAANHPSSATFLADRHDVIIADDADQSVVLVIGADQLATRVPVVSSGDGFEAISGVDASDDGRRIFITSKNSENVTVVDLESNMSSLVSCHCQAAGLHRLKARDVFRLNDLSAAPVALLDASLPEARVIVIPPAQGVAAPAPDGDQGR